MPILREGELDIYSHSPQQTARLGARLGQLLQAGDVVCLLGDMGAGKTVFSSGIGQGWGAKNKLTSPTYNLVHQHTREEDDTKLYHLDCYRLRDSRDVDSIGFDDMVDEDGILIIEWAERIQDVLPEKRLWIEIRATDDLRRNFMLEAFGERSEILLNAFRDAAFGITK